MEKFKLLKVFDCQDMPPDVKKAFFAHHNACNDVFVRHYIYDSWKFVEITDPNLCTYSPDVLDELTDGEILFEENSDGLRKVIQRGDNIVSDWLFDNGATVDEEVIVSHWW